MKNRAYSLITIKAVSEEDRIIEGLASTPTPDRMGDVVNPMGAKFSLPLPFLWQHQHDQPIGHVIEANPSEKGISFRAQIAQTDEPGTLKDLLDFGWQSIKMKLVAAVSIGFRPLEYAFLDNGGIRYDEWEWYELSAVTIPAQAEATINMIKSVDTGLRHAAGIPDPEFPSRPRLVGVSGPEILLTSAPAASGKSARVVMLNAPARDRAKPFVIRSIKRNT